VATEIRAITLVLENPSLAAASLRDVFGWTVDSDFGAFASLALPGGIPLWINAPASDGAVTRNVVIHLAAGDVDAAFEEAVGRGAQTLRVPTDMDYGERSAWVTTELTPGIIFDFSHPLH
jgi:predicted enzyme related to lactoylglutathione lyase